MQAFTHFSRHAFERDLLRQWNFGPAGGTRYIFANQAKAPCLRGPVSSNVIRYTNEIAVT